MTYEKWQQICYSSNKDKKPGDIASSSDITDSSESSIDKPRVLDETEDPGLLNVWAVEVDSLYDHLPPPREEDQMSQPGVLSTASISEFIDQHLEIIKRECHELDSVTRCLDEDNKSPIVSLQCSSCPHDEHHTVPELKKAGPEFARFGKLLEVLIEVENEGTGI